jgi:hypothetical protein
MDRATPACGRPLGRLGAATQRIHSRPPHAPATPLALSRAQDFNPLELCAKLQPLLERLADAHAPLSSHSPVKAVLLDKYVPCLKQVAVLRMLRQLSEVYSTMRISELAALVPFYT